MNKTIIAHVIEEFELPKEDYKLIDMEKNQGWGTKLLNRIDFANGEKYILKGKDPVQVVGLVEAAKLSDYFCENDFLVRKPVKTNSGDYYLEYEHTTWTIAKYLEGKDSVFKEFSADTVKSLAENVNEYLALTKGQEALAENFSIEHFSKKNLFDFLDSTQQQNVWGVLSELIPEELPLMQKWLLENNEKVTSVYDTANNKAIIHGDLNSKNILTTSDGSTIAAIIDWDHCRYDLIYIDLANITNELLEHLDYDKASDFNDQFLGIIKAAFADFDARDFELISKYQATKDKWSSVLFYTDLLIRYGNTTNEEERFKSTIMSEAAVWKRLMSN